jgi:cation:H+ antiporter
MKESVEDESGDVKIHSNLKSIGLVVLGVLMLVGGGKVVVDNATFSAHYYGLSVKLIGLTILAVGTSLPELATTAVAAYRKHTDIAIGNVVGSNIFNIFFILGITGMISPMSFNTAFNMDIYILIAATVLLMVFMFTINQRKLDRWEAVILLCGYIVYTLYVVNVE